LQQDPKSKTVFSPMQCKRPLGTQVKRRDRCLATVKALWILVMGQALPVISCNPTLALAGKELSFLLIKTCVRESNASGRTLGIHQLQLLETSWPK
jgi:hypothetical protein